MAEILVSDFCDDRPGAGNGGRAFAFAPEDRRREWAESAERARAAALADLIPAAHDAKKRKKIDSL